MALKTLIVYLVLPLLLATTLSDKMEATSTRTTTESNFTQLMTDELSETLISVFEHYERRLKSMEGSFKSLTRQVMLQQLNAEQRIRTGGQSGVKSIRGSIQGPLNYYSASHVGKRFIAVHDHADFLDTVGMGEINAVMNGVDFVTRHNDYKLMQASTTSSDYHATEPIQLPKVPRSVSKSEDIDSQVDEMRQYFKAFATQNKTLRNYKPYFKPVLCYLEGAWTLDKKIEEPFESDRHHLDAVSWEELHDMIRYTSYTGSKSPDENWAYLPTKIIDIDKSSGKPTIAQWNYRILCAPIEENIPLNYLKEVKDYKYVYPRHKVNKGTRLLRSSRFILNEKEQYNYYFNNILDRLFSKIPGKNNIPSNLTQEGYGYTLYSPVEAPHQPQDTSLYHRSSELGGADAMGNKFLARGFNDPYMFSAETTQPRVEPIQVRRCSFQKEKGKGQLVKTCREVSTRFSWAIPLEIIYLTPLYLWNPYKIPYHETKGKVTANRRNGMSKETAYNGSDTRHYYRTPVSFYQGDTESTDSADTAVGDGVWTLDQTGTPRRCAASGVRITTPEIKGVGRVRLRFPIAPVHGEGSGVWKELNAFKDMVIENQRQQGQQEKLVEFQMGTTNKDPPGKHSHDFTLSSKDVRRIRDKGKRREVVTSLNQGHTHRLLIIFRDGKFMYLRCDKLKVCKDRHPKEVFPKAEDVKGL